MRIGYFADGLWSHRALELIVADGRFEIAFIVPRHDSRDPVLADWARRLGVDFLVVDNVNAPEALERFRAHAPDLFVSMSFNQIFRRPALAAAPLGTINCHAGALPFYRGRNILNWALINDAHEFGVTVHYVDEGIDTGDIILQVRHPIGDDDTYATLLERATGMCAVALRDALVMLAEGSVHRTPQTEIHPVGFYCGRRRPGDEWIDWSWPSRRIFNFVRAISPPGPCARAAYAGAEILIERASLIPAAPPYLGVPGEIVGSTPDGAVVKTGDSTIAITPAPGASAAFRIGGRFQGRDAHLRDQLLGRIESLERELDQLRGERARA